MIIVVPRTTMGPDSSQEQAQILQTPPRTRGRLTKCVSPPTPASISSGGRVVLCLHQHERRVCVTSFLSAHMPPRMPFRIESHWEEMAGGGHPSPFREEGELATCLGMR